MIRFFGTLLNLILAIALCGANLWALGTEEFGNKPLNENNYGNWPGISPVVNTKARVYSNWVNGNEHFYCVGDTADLNVALKDFAAIETPDRQLVIRPGIGETRTFQGKKVRFDWEVHLMGGISSHITTLHKGDQIWSKSPVLTVYLGDNIDLSQLEIPEGITLVSLTKLKKRFVDAILTSTDLTVRGWGCGELAQLDPMDQASVEPIVTRLQDQEIWVRQNAAGALAAFGAKAQIALEPMREASKSDDEGLKDESQKSIAAIEADVENHEKETRYQNAMKEIEKFYLRHEKPTK